MQASSAGQPWEALNQRQVGERLDAGIKAERLRVLEAHLVRVCVSPKSSVRPLGCDCGGSFSVLASVRQKQWWLRSSWPGPEPGSSRGCRRKRRGLDGFPRRSRANQRQLPILAAIGVETMEKSIAGFLNDVGRTVGCCLIYRRLERDEPALWLVREGRSAGEQISWGRQREHK